MPMIPKSWAALTDALDASLGFALNRVEERLPAPKDEAKYSAWREECKEQMRNEILNAICERFDFRDTGDES